jgi:hypothetical protein
VPRGRLTQSAVAGALAVAAVIAAGGAAVADDQSTARKLVITPADVTKAHVGEKFVAQSTGDSGGGDTSSNNFAALAECVGKPVPSRALTANAAGPALLARSGHSQITSFADIVQTTAMAKADRAVVKSRAFPDCLGKLAEQQSGGGITSVVAERVPVKHYGDYSTAVRAQAEGTSNGQPITFSIVLVLTQKGRAELTGEFQTDSATAFNRKEGEKILDRLAPRIDRAKV